MKLRTLAATVLLGAAASATSVHAQAPEPCTLYLCMAGISGFGASGGPACAASIAFWHSPTPGGLAVYHPPQGFNPPASAALRRSYMASGCKGSTGTNAAILAAIMAQHGYSP